MRNKNRKREEFYNVVTHGIGAILSIIAIILMSISAINSDSYIIFFSCLVFGLSLFMLYSSSTIYHASTTLRRKRFWKRMDHLSIYLLIAGSYTPFVLVGLQGAWGWSIFGVIWTLVIIGFLFKFSRWRYNKKISVSIYVLMGWLCVIAIKPIIDNFDKNALLFLLLGGLSYTSGVYFYAKDYKRYYHAIWHLFVLAGSIFHFCAIYFYII